MPYKELNKELDKKLFKDKHGRTYYYNFLHGLALAFPDLCSRFLKSIDLDVYEDYDGSPNDLRAPENDLNVELQSACGDIKATAKLRGHKNIAPTVAEVWREYVPPQRG